MKVGQVDDAWIEGLGERVASALPEWRPDARLASIRSLTGGTSSLTFLADLEGVESAYRKIVVKVAPPGLPPVRNRDVLRQARLQKALQAADGPPLAPDSLFTDAGLPPEVPPFMAMNMVAGACAEPILVPLEERPGAEVVHERYLRAAAMLARLHAVDVAAVGLADEPVATLASEIDRWTRAFETVPEQFRGRFREAEQALRDTMPEAIGPVINHGDYRLGNILCDGVSLNAIIDWEIWSVGDPRIDVAWLSYFADDAGHPAAQPGPPAGTPKASEVIGAYETHRGAPLPDLGWFHALTRYKEASLTGLLLKRALKDGKEFVGWMARMEPALPRLVDETLELVEKEKKA